MTAARTDKKTSLLICVALALGTLALYGRVIGYPFIQFDDVDYISANPDVTGGLNWPNVVWAFNGAHVGNWHPLTWLSHMLDCQCFGLQAGYHHLVNVLWHTANSLLLFWFLLATTGFRWRSACVAALFAWHPLHVESVAWVAERKDGLSTFFWLLTLLAYARYAQGKANALAGTAAPGTRHPFRFYALALGAYALAIMSKPMVVTLPFVLLLLDYWPLQRLPAASFQFSIWKRILIEKIPFALLSLALCVGTFLAQDGSGAVMNMARASRLGNIPVSYVRYLSKTFWPADLSIYYPYIHDWSIAASAGSALVLLLISGLALVLIRRQPWLMVGWFWFLGTLVPAIGFVQVGLQSMADRYTYIPSIGLFIVIVWGVCEFYQRRPAFKPSLPLIGGAALVACVVTTTLQLSYWQSSVKLFFHAVDTTTDNFVALNSLGCALKEIGRNDEAIKVFEESIRIESHYWPSHRNLAMSLLDKHEPDAAFQRFNAVLNLKPDDASLRYELSLYLLGYQRIEAAKTQLAAALVLNPAYPEAHDLLGAIARQQAKPAEAIPHFLQALKLNPNYAEAQFNLGLALEQQGQFREAVGHYRVARRLAPDSPAIVKALKQILAAHPELKLTSEP